MACRGTARVVCVAKAAELQLSPGKSRSRERGISGTGLTGWLALGTSLQQLLE